MASTSNMRTSLDPNKEYFWHNPRHDELVITHANSVAFEDEKGKLYKFYLRNANDLLTAMGCTLLGEV